MSDERLALKTSRENRVLEQQQQAVFAMRTGEDQLGFIYARQEQGVWRLMGSNAFPVKPDERCTVFITKTASDYFRQIAQDFDEQGQLTTYRMPARAFQVFTITEKSKPQS